MPDKKPPGGRGVPQPYLGCDKLPARGGALRPLPTFLTYQAHRNGAIPGGAFLQKKPVSNSKQACYWLL